MKNFCFAKVGWVLILGLFFLSTSLSANDLKIKFTDKSKLKYDGDWLLISYQAYTSKTVGSGGRRGTMTCKPGLTGKYQIITEFKATVNRGNRAKYYVDGSLVKEIDQRAGVVEGKSAFPKVSLGVFDLKPDSTIELRAQDGKSYSFVAFIFTTSTAPISDPIAGGGDAGNEPAERSFTAKKDGELVIEPYLSTYSPATFKVTVDGKEVFSWVRSNSTTKEPCAFQGAADEKSMYEIKPGDFSPSSGLKYTMAIKAGQKVQAVKSGGFESDSFLKISGPFDGTEAAKTDETAAGKDDEKKTGDKTDEKAGETSTKDAKKAGSMEEVLGIK
ncbi:MAG: hypothetical protein ACOYXC_20635 [Candidatus Rifleibacteriota bacterium]